MMTTKFSVCVLLALAMMPSLCAAAEWKEVKLNDQGISAIFHGEEEKTTGCLRSMPPNMTGPIVSSIVGSAKYYAAVSQLPRNLSLRAIARTFSRNEVKYQEQLLKEHEDAFLRSTGHFVTLSKLKSLKFEGQDAIDFSIDIEVLIPSIGFGTWDKRLKVCQENLRVIRVDDSVVVMGREQFLGPFNSDWMVKRFFNGLKIPAKKVADKKSRRVSTEVPLKGHGKWKNDFLIPIRIFGKDGWKVQSSAQQPVTTQPGGKVTSATNSTETRESGLRAERSLEGSNATLRIEFHSLSTDSFDEFVTEHAARTLQADSGASGELHKPVSARNIVWRHGRRCWQVDIDQFDVTGCRSRRLVYLPTSAHAVVFTWSTTDPEDRARFDGWHDAMVRVGVPVADSRTSVPNARSVLNWFGDYAVYSRSVTNTNKVINDSVATRGRLIREAQSEFLRVMRSADSTAATKARSILAAAEKEQEKIASLLVVRTRIQMNKLKQNLKRTNLDSVQTLFPELFASLSP